MCSLTTTENWFSPLPIPEKELQFTMTSTVDDQFIYSAASEIREGGVFVKGTKEGKEITGYGFGERVNYSGEEFALKENMKLLGIDDTETNRSLLVVSPPRRLDCSSKLCGADLLERLVVLLILGIILLVKRRKQIIRVSFFSLSFQ